jgi:hypothetical protein
MLEKILSSGRSGAERAALDLALELGLSCGGTFPAEAAAERPPIDELTPLSGADADACLEQNVVESDGTLMITFGRLCGDTDLARRLSLRHGRQLLHIDAAKTELSAAAELIRSWIEVYGITVLHVTGVDEEKSTALYAAAASILAFAIEPLQRRIGAGGRNRPPVPGGRPATLQQAVNRIESEMTLREKAIFANTEGGAANRLFLPLVQTVVARFGLAGGNRLLLGSCRAAGKQPEMGPEEAALLILDALWKSLRKAYRIRVVK